MQTATKTRLTAEEYLALERKAETKSEFVDGAMFAMAGGTEEHSLIASNLIREVGTELKSKPCKVYTADMRVKIEATGLCTYPDVHVACGDSRFEDAHRDTLLNPKVIFEILSQTTAAWDRGQKFWHYRHLESLTDYVLVSQDAWLVEHYTRQPNGAWLLETLEGQGEVLHLSAVGARVPLAEIYAKTGLSPKTKPAPPPAASRQGHNA